MLILGSAIKIVEQQKAYIIERLGKYNRTLQPGIHFIIPLVERVAHKANLKTQQLTVVVETKTKDNVFVRIPCAVQFVIPNDLVEDSFYKLDHPMQQIESYVLDNVRTSLAKLDLDTAFSAKDDIALNIETALANRMQQYGYKIVNTLVMDIAPNQEVMDSMNSINVAQRKRDAAISLAEAEKIKVVKEAEAAAEAKHLQGVGIAQQRQAIAEGLAHQIDTLTTKGISPAEANQVLALNQYLDTLVAVASDSGSRVLMLPSNPGGINNLQEQIRDLILAQDYGPTPK